MKKETLKGLVIGSLVGVGAGICGMIIANRGVKKDNEKINEIHENTTDDKMENFEARIYRLENECTMEKAKSTYFIVGGFLLALYMCVELDKNFKHIQEKHNGMVEHVAKAFGMIGDVCEDLDNRIGVMEVK